MSEANISNENIGIASIATPSTLLSRLKDYRETIGIVVFFLAGFMWIYGFFATKTQVDVIKCISDNHVILLESKMDKKFMMDKYAQISMQLKNNSHDKNESLLAEQVVSLELDMTSVSNELRLSKELDLLWDDIKQAQARYRKALQFLKSSSCQYLQS